MASRGSPKISLLSVALSALILFSASGKADEPSPAAIQSANRLIAVLGLIDSLNVVVPVLFGEFEKNVVATRPELKDPLHQVLVSLVAEFDKGEPAVLDNVARVMASKLTEAEIKEVLAFYESPTGKKFVAAEPAMVDELQVAGTNWRQKLADDLLPRVREELKKKGVDF